MNLTRMMTDKVFFEDKHGTRIGPYKTRFGTDRITVFQDELNVTEGDRVIQPLPDGIEQAYIAEAVAYNAARRNIPGHFSIAIAKAAASPGPAASAMDTMNGIFEGSCQCGAIRYQVTGKAMTLFCCHCTECKKQSGSAFGMALWIKTEKLDTQGARLSSWTRHMPSGKRMFCDFCPECGTRLFHRTEGNPDIVSIKPGTLENRHLMAPVAHIWTGSAYKWETFGSECLLYPANPDNVEKLVSAWQARHGGDSGDSGLA